MRPASLKKGGQGGRRKNSHLHLSTPGVQPESRLQATKMVSMIQQNTDVHVGLSNLMVSMVSMTLFSFLPPSRVCVFSPQLIET